MKKARLLAIGDDVCDKYLSRGKMYPGGQAVNTCAYAVMNGVEAAFLGKFGSDEVAQCLKDTLDALGIDRSRCRSFEGENGFACVTLAGSDRVFIGSNKGGVAAVNPYGFTQEDLAKRFSAARIRRELVELTSPVLIPALRSRPRKSRRPGCAFKSGLFS